MTQRLNTIPLTDKDIKSLISLFEKQSTELKQELAERQTQRIYEVMPDKPLEIGKVIIL